jgi:hypothetical protein
MHAMQFALFLYTKGTEEGKWIEIDISCMQVGLINFYDLTV